MIYWLLLISVDVGIFQADGTTDSPAVKASRTEEKTTAAEDSAFRKPAPPGYKPKPEKSEGEKHKNSDISDLCGLRNFIRYIRNPMYTRIFLLFCTMSTEHFIRYIRLSDITQSNISEFYCAICFHFFSVVRLANSAREASKCRWMNFQKKSKFGALPCSDIKISEFFVEIVTPILDAWNYLNICSLIIFPFVEVAKVAQTEEEKNESTVFVSNLSFDVSEDQLRKVFSKVGRTIFHKCRVRLSNF